LDVEAQIRGEPITANSAASVGCQRRTLQWQLAMKLAERTIRHT
jgi:hypothetical protein